MNIFDLKLYKPNDLERWIADRYQDNGIHYAVDLDIDHVADIFGVEVRMYTGPSFAEWKDDEYSFLFINGYLPEEQRREQFFHKLCHPLRHAGRQDSHKMPQSLIKLQETQAEHFQLYAAMPWYMLEEFEAITHYATFPKVIAEAFTLPLPLVQKRIAQMMRRMYQEHRDRNMRARRAPSAITTGYEPETLRILEQLDRQLTAKKGVSG